MRRINQSILLTILIGFILTIPVSASYVSDDELFIQALKEQMPTISSDLKEMARYSGNYDFGSLRIKNTDFSNNCARNYMEINKLDVSNKFLPLKNTYLKCLIDYSVSCSFLDLALDSYYKGDTATMNMNFRASTKAIESATEKMNQCMGIVDQLTNG